MSNNPLIIATFLKQMDECLEDISKTYSTDTRFSKCKLYFETMKRTNPRMVITTWKTMVTDKYDAQIQEGNIDYFLEKDYAEDAQELYTPTVDSTIQELRATIKKMSPENKEVSLKYLQNLCKLSKLYV